MDETKTLVKFLSGLDYVSLPPAVREMAKLCILDTVGVGLFGSRMQWANIAADVAKRGSKRSGSAVWGTSLRSVAEYAVLANGIAAHGIEMDDRKPPYDGHTGATVVPTALALGEEGGISGEQLIAAVVAGYESAYRVGKAVPGQMERGIHAPGHKAIWGGVAAASKALGLDFDQTLNAFGIAGSMASGIWEFTNDPQRAMVKRMHDAWPAHGGVTAALLAQRGFAGPSTVLEGKYGYCNVYAGKEPLRLNAITEDPGNPFKIMEREVKPYAAWGGSHVVIEGIYKIMQEGGVTPDRIDSITVGCSEKLLLGHTVKNPGSMMAAQYNLPFLVAVAFFKDLRDPAVWTDELIRDKMVLALVEKVSWHVDDEMERNSKETATYGGVKVSVRLKDGRELSAIVWHSKGTVENPMTPEEIAGKFTALAAHVIPGPQVASIRETVGSLEKVKNVRRLGKLLMVSAAG